MNIGGSGGLEAVFEQDGELRPTMPHSRGRILHSRSWRFTVPGHPNSILRPIRRGATRQLLTRRGRCTRPPGRRRRPARPAQRADDCPLLAAARRGRAGSARDRSAPPRRSFAGSLPSSPTVSMPWQFVTQKDKLAGAILGSLRRYGVRIPWLKMLDRQPATRVAPIHAHDKNAARRLLGISTL